MEKKTFAELAEMSQDDRYRYWASRSDTEKWNATVELSKARYIELGLYKEGDGMDKTVFRKFATREEWLLAEEEASKVLRS